MKKTLKIHIKKMLLKTSFGRWVYEEYARMRLKIFLAKKRSTFRKKYLSVLNDFCSALNEVKVPFWICYGTLLGFVRDNAVLLHDYDFDFGIWKSDWSEKIEDILFSKGFCLVHQFESESIVYDAFEQTYEKDGVSIDIFCHYKDHEKTWTHVFYREPEDEECLPKGVYRIRKLDYPTAPLIQVNFLGNLVYMPENAEIYLEEIYGKEWRIPDPNYDWHKGPKNNCTLKNVYGRYILGTDKSK